MSSLIRWPAVQYVFLIPVLLILCDGYAQTKFGLKTGTNLSRMIMKSDTAGWDAYSVSPSIHIGAFGTLEISRRVKLGAELLVSDKGFRLKGDGFFDASHLLYVNIPLYADVRIVDRLSLQVGPEIGLLTTAWGKHKEYLSALYSNRFDFGVIAGLQYDITNSLGLSLRFEQGLSNVVGKDASVLQYNYGSGDPVIEGQNLRENGVVHRNQTVQLSINIVISGDR